MGITQRLKQRNFVCAAQHRAVVLFRYLHLRIYLRGINHDHELRLSCFLFSIANLQAAKVCCIQVVKMRLDARLKIPIHPSSSHNTASDPITPCL